MGNGRDDVGVITLLVPIKNDALLNRTVRSEHQAAARLVVRGGLGERVVEKDVIAAHLALGDPTGVVYVTAFGIRDAGDGGAGSARGEGHLHVVGGDVITV